MPLADPANGSDPPHASLPFSLEIPGHAEFVGTARIFAAAVARQTGFDEEMVEDVKLVVSEACNFCIGGRTDPSPHSLRIGAEEQDGHLRFEVLDVAPQPATGEGSGTQDQGWSLELIRTLTSNSAVEAGPAVTRVTFSLPAHNES
jgi:anti-sigma regulatory factor (Ser/Thr protein kinase)